jgi:23S rRNA U2552 (ribose-2'-O)-methylase RlmE/FtsJ
MRRSYKTVRIIKPSASRPESREVYVLGQIKR